MVAIPFIEPSVHAESSHPLSDREREAARNATHPYHDLLAEHFSPGHWALEKQPKVLESLQTQTTLVVQDIRTRKDGNIELIPCAIIVSPRKRESGRDNGSDAIILEAPEGAVLKFDKIDLRKAGWTVTKGSGGVLPIGSALENGIDTRAATLPALSI